MTTHMFCIKPVYCCVQGKSSGGGKKKNETLQQTRRRLSVVSDNKLVEGLSGLSQKEAEGDSSSTSLVCPALTGWYGISKKGYAPYNPRKKNQDILIMEQHAETKTVLLCVFDGHGEAGDGVSQFFKAQLPPTLFAHPSFNEVGVADEKDKMKAALEESVAFLERNLLRGTTD